MASDRASQLSPRLILEPKIWITCILFWTHKTLTFEPGVSVISTLEQEAVRGKQYNNWCRDEFDGFIQLDL